MTAQLMLSLDDSYVLLPVSEKLVAVWRMTEAERARFELSGRPEGDLLADRVYADKITKHLLDGACVVYRACARFDPDYVLPWGRWRFRKRGRKDYRGLWSFSQIVEPWVHRDDRHYTIRLRVSPCFACWEHNSRMPPEVVIDSVELRRITT